MEQEVREELAAFARPADWFAQYLTVEKGLSPNTCEAYRSDLMGFAAYCAGRGLKSWEEVTADHIAEYFGLRYEQHMARNTVARELISLRMFYRYCAEERILPADVTKLVESPKVAKVLPHVLTEEETEALLAAPDPETPAGLRDRAMLELLYATGLRVSELVTLPKSALNLQEGFLQVTGKGNKTRLVPVGRPACRAVAEYLATRCEEPRNPNVFLSNRGRPMTRVNFWYMIKKYALAAGIQKEISPHVLRHSFATHLLMHGADLRVVQEMLGHSSVTTTERYTHVEYSHVRGAHRKFHPHG